MPVRQGGVGTPRTLSDIYTIPSALEQREPRATFSRFFFGRRLVLSALALFSPESFRAPSASSGA